MHDRNGVILAHGDLVLIPAKIVGTSNTEEFCNVVCETLVPLYPSVMPTTISLNARQIEKAPAGKATAEAVLGALDESAQLDLAIGASGVDTSEGAE